MQILTFKVFSDLAESSSFSKAAEVNGVTQSAVSQQVRTLEERLHVKLIERGRKNFSLTPEGRAVLEASRDILGTMTTLKGRITRLQNSVSGELRISTIFSVGLHELPPILKVYRKSFPDVDVRVEYRRSSEVYASVLEGRADVGLAAYPASRRGIEATTFWRDRLALICPPGHPLGRRRRVKLSALEGQKFVAFEPDLPTRREVDRRLRAAGVKVQFVLEFDNIETVKRAVGVENAISIVPETTVRDEVDGGTLCVVGIDDPGMWRPLGTLIRRSARVSPALREFLSLLKTFDRASLPGAGKSRRAGNSS